MNILVIGNSAREHAFIKKISESKRADKIFCIQGNPAIAELAECVNIPIDDLTSISEFAKENKIDLTICLNEYAIQNGIADIFSQENLKIFAPTIESAKIATSRAFAKKFLYKNKIPTPKYGLFDKENSAIDYAKKSQFPLIVKYDHLAHQDSFICTSFIKAQNIISRVFNNVEKRVVIEEFLEGEVVTFSILTDGYSVLPLPYVREYKKLSKQDKVITKGVGAYTPFNKISQKTEAKIAKKIIFPILDALQNNNTPYTGFLSVQILLLPNNDIKVLEFLPTLSIPEATCILQLIEDDLLDAIFATTEGALEDCYQSLNISDDACVSVAIFDKNYPENEITNYIITGVEDIEDDNIELYYNNVGMNSFYEIVTNGGRPFFMTSRALTLNKARENLYKNIDIIDFKNKSFRSDVAEIKTYKDF